MTAIVPKKQNKVHTLFAGSVGEKSNHNVFEKLLQLPNKGIQSIKRSFEKLRSERTDVTAMTRDKVDSLESFLPVTEKKVRRESGDSMVSTITTGSKKRDRGSISNRTVPFAKWSRKLYGSEKAECALMMMTNKPETISGVLTLQNIDYITSSLHNTYFKPETVVEDEHLKVIRAGRFVIHPFSNFRFAWDVCSSILIIFNIVLIPMDIAFSSEKSGIGSTVFKLLSDVWFLIDILLNFRTGIPKHGDDHTAIELDYKYIQRRYFRTWFFVDFIASFPFDFVVTLTVRRFDYKKSTYLVRLLRIGKMLSLVRVARIPRLLRGLHRWEEIFNLQYDMAVSFLRFSNLIFIIFLTCHWNGCLQYMIPMFYDFPENTWVKIHGLDHPNVTWFEAYSWSLFKSTSHMLCIGFSRVIPRSMIDLWTTMLSQVTGAVLFGVFISNAINLMEEMDVSKNAYNSKIAQIREYLSFRRVPMMMRRRILDYFDVRYGGKLFDEEQILTELSPDLRREVIWYNTAVLIQSVTLFDDVSDDFVAEIGKRLFFTVFTPEDWLVKEGTKAFHMFFIQRGIVIICLEDGTFIRQLSDGMHFGETCLLHKDLERAASAQALTNVFTYTLHRSDFLKVIKQHPEDKVKIHKRFHILKERTSMYQMHEREINRKQEEQNVSSDTE